MATSVRSTGVARKHGARVRAASRGARAAWFGSAFRPQNESARLVAGLSRFVAEGHACARPLSKREGDAGA